MLARPRLRSSLAAAPVGAALVFLLDEHRSVVLEGAVYTRLLPLLDGTRSLADIVGELGATSFAEVTFALSRLERHGCLVEGDEFVEGLDPVFVDGLTRGTANVPVAALASGIELRAVGAIEDARLRRALAACRIGVRNDPQVPLLVLADDYLRDELDEINREALSAHRPWLLAKTVGMITWIGPVFVPHETGCWECLAQRLRANRQVQGFIRRARGSDNGVPIVNSRVVAPTVAELAADLVATETARWLLAPQTHRLRGSVVTWDLLQATSRRHQLMRRPQCRTCGDADWTLGGDQPRIELRSRKKRFTGDGGHRSRTPAETLAAFEHHVSPIIGAVTYLEPARVPLPETIPVFAAGHNFALGVDDIVSLRRSLRGISGGKGVTAVQSKVSGLCEALERFSGVYTGEEHRVRASFSELAPEAIHPNDCMGFSDEQYAAREQLNAAQPFSRCVLIPHPFDEDLAVDWSPLWSLTEERRRYLPTALCFYDHPEFAARWCAPESNGCAAGNNLEEAILQGFFELIERDAVALWWYNRVRRAGVDLDSFHLPYLDDVRDYYASIGRDLWVLDVTGDFDIATFACLSRRLDGPADDILLGFGAHFDPAVALLRSVTEVNQSLPVVFARNDDGSTRYSTGDELSLHWWTTARVEDLDYLRPDPTAQLVGRAAFEDPSSNDLRDDVHACVELARQKDLEVLVLDQTRPDVGLSVVKVAVPGLCHFWRRFGQRRLYDVPVRMRWRREPPSADELNPYTVFF
jgi:ribosomal protein S12 methylthiotransferase accessory factor